MGWEMVAIPRNLLEQIDQLRKFVEKERPDYIFHLSAYGNHYFQTEEDLVYKANVEALFNLMEATKRLSFKGFFNFSTTFHNLEAGSFYGSTKAAGEYLVRAYVRKYDLPIVSIRPYSVYGEREWDFRFIPTISRQIKANKPITVSDVSHDWIYVEDFIDGLLESVRNVDELKGKAVGIGTGTRVSNVEIAKTLMEIVGIRVPIINGVKRSYEIAAYSKKIINKDESQRNEVEYFNFAKTPLEVGLKKVYENQTMSLVRAG